MRVDYTVFYKRKYIKDDLSGLAWDVFISAFNDSQRVTDVYEIVVAKEKHWLIMPDYNYAESECPENSFRCQPDLTEDEYIINFFNKNPKLLNSKKICIDITGFMRPHLIFMFRYFVSKGIEFVDVIYSDPVSYKKKERTSFTKDKVYNVRQIRGCEGYHVPDTKNDILIIGAGYDHKLIASAADNKAKARKLQLYGFPSLHADMYQENIINAYVAEDALGGGFLDENRSYYAPANDPFVTASVLSQIVKEHEKNEIITNLYLSPLSTKAQTLGFIIYYLWECMDKSVSIIFPFCQEYNRETSVGLSKIWHYKVELPNVAS